MPQTEAWITKQVQDAKRSIQDGPKWLQEAAKHPVTTTGAQRK